MKTLRYSLLLLGVLFTASCKTIFKTYPYQQYVESLNSSGLNSTKMGQKWLEVGKATLSKPNEVLKFPFKEEVFFREEQPAAVAYNLLYKENSKLKIMITGAKYGVYMDLFEKGNAKQIVGEFVKDTTLYYDSSSDKTLILRLQPQLLINEYVQVTMVEEAKLGFPVLNGKNSDIKSFWGADRDGGARSHEGIDIFNKRGTPVIAVEDGTISRVQVTNLGGKVVWQRLRITGPSIYYAHLDSQLVTDGQKVKKGTILGLMGNTGNAKTTSPHLHFGIYTGSGAVNPIDYVLVIDSVPGKLILDAQNLGKEFMIKGRTRYYSSETNRSLNTKFNLPKLFGGNYKP